MKTLHLTTCLFFSLLFVGCINIVEEIWVNTDGTARIKIDIGMPEAMFSMGESEGGQDPFADLDKEFQKTKEDVEKNPDISRIDFKQYSEGGVKHFVFDVEVRNYKALNDFQKIVYAEEPDQEGGGRDMPLENSELVVEAQNGSLVFSRQIGQKPEGETQSEEDSLGNAMEDMGQAMADAMFGNYTYTVRLYAENITESNGTINEQKNMAEWKIPFGQLMSGKHRELRAEIVPSNGLLMWIVAFVLIGAIVGGLVVLLRRKKEVLTMPQP